MTLEFMDGTQLEVRDIYGGPRLVQGVMRDTLRIEVSPHVCGFDDLREMFMDNPNTRHLYTYVNNQDEDGKSITSKVEVGEGYLIFVSISDEIRKVPPIPGKMVPDETEEIYVVQIAQQTYAEYTGG